ncbi:hypothetical protein GCM10011583_52720 [Streptomyces camponoticapitis]|uniref:Solute-binding protein family 3/N-terminal domain-containing protein n=1 Tax=Streptomyces camponoticapitis TaxID=1616125 RepID=A0ABQ2EJ72_9ACTN|nr:transporter substrate-binding domain-containing protein [Streptomyces camponoticapitis]GGK14211.1 hypothetical protein GCM10011583_52720 [Streptomyces camponoticapitis]
MRDEERPTHPLRTSRHGPVEAETPEGAELAKWLRARVGGRTLRQLEGIFPHPRRTQWSEFLKGRKLIPLWLLNDVVTKLVAPQDQQLHRGLGRQLLAAAEEAGRTRREAESPTTASQGTTAHEHQVRLNDALEGQIKAQETVQSLTHLIYAFITAMADLNQRCRNLEIQRDEARLRLSRQEMETTTNQRRAEENKRRAADDARRVAEAEERLAETERRLIEFEERLARARWEKHNAEDLRIEAFRQAEQRRRAIEPSPGEGTPPGSFEEGSRSVPVPRPWEYDHFLETADAQLDYHEAGMVAIREQIGSAAPAPAPDFDPASPDRARTIPGQVVPGPSTDSPDRPDTGTNTVRAVSTDGADGADSPDKVRPRPERGPEPEPVRNGPKRRALLAGGICLAVLAGGGWLVWNQYHPTREYALTDSPAIKDAQTDGGVLRIGVKADQPGLSEEIGGEWVGFDIEFAKNIAKDLGFEGESVIDFIPVTTKTRDDQLNNGQIHLMVGSYSVTDDRKKEVDFAGPYFITDQGMMVYTGSSGDEAWVEQNGKQTRKKINEPDDFPDGTVVCTVGKSISKTILDKLPASKFKIKEESDYQTCVDNLNSSTDGTTGSTEPPVRAVVTDRPILAGFLAANPDLAMVPNPLEASTTGWGVGIAKGDAALRHFVCESIADQIDDGTWREIYREELEDHLQEENIKATPPREELRTECPG